MPPSHDSVRAQVEALGHDFELVPYHATDVLEQARALLATVGPDAAQLTRRGLLTPTDVVLLSALVEHVAANASAPDDARISFEEYGRRIAEAIAPVGELKRELILWAKASDVPYRLFDLNMGQGSAAHFCEAAELLLKLLARHRERFLDPARIDVLRQRLRVALNHVSQAREARGLARTELDHGMLREQQYLRLLYDTLLRVSRVGRAAFFEDTPKREAYRLAVLQPRVPTREDGDDDAPIVPAEFGELVESTPL